MMLKLALGLLSFAAFAQEQTMQLTESPEFTAAGITVVLASSHAAETAAIIQGDEALLGPIVPFSVLVTNNSGRKLKAIGVRFTWKDSRGFPGGAVNILTAMVNDNDPNQIATGTTMLMTPTQDANDFALKSPEQRKARFTQSSQPSIGSGVQSKSDLGAKIGETAGRLNTVSDLRATLECVVFDDYSFVGSANARRMLHDHEPRIH
jgi:hypothetical protein